MRTRGWQNTHINIWTIHLSSTKEKKEEEVVSCSYLSLLPIKCLISRKGFFHKFRTALSVISGMVHCSCATRSKDIYTSFLADVCVNFHSAVCPFICLYLLFAPDLTNSIVSSFLTSAAHLFTCISIFGIASLSNFARLFTKQILTGYDRASQSRKEALYFKPHFRRETS